MRRPNIHAVAVAYRARGWSFYPTRPRSKEPFSELLPQVRRPDGKIAPAWSPFQTALPSRADVDFWFRDIAPNANLALVTGAVSNLVILDIDNESARDSLLRLLGASALEDLGTPLVRSRQGWHLYFAHPGETVTGRLATGRWAEVDGKREIETLAGIDVKGDGGCCTAPPSIHHSGHLYHFIQAPSRYRLQPVPRPVMDALATYHAMKQSRIQAEAPPPGWRPMLGQGAQYGRKALQNAIQALQSTRAHRNDALYAAAFSLGRLVATGAIDRATVQAALFNVALEIGLTPGETRATLASGLGDGLQVPRHIPPPQPRAPIRRQPAQRGPRAPKYQSFPTLKAQQ